VRVVSVDGFGVAKGKGVAIELEKADFGRVVLWAWDTVRKLMDGEVVEGVVDV
jgi:hypothetical protein